MHEAVAFSFLIFLLSVSVFAKTSIPVFDKARQIKLLESTRKDVRKIFADLKTTEEQTEEEKQEAENFETEAAYLEVLYSSGTCSEEAERTDEWKISEDKVKFIGIYLKEAIKIEDFDFDISGFIKEQRYSNIEDDFVYHDKKSGLSFLISDGEIKNIKIIPSSNYSNQLCENEEGEELKEFYARESFFTESELKDRVYIASAPANVTALTVSAKNLVIGCVNANGKAVCADNMKVDVETGAVDPETHTLVYNYTVSGGTIIGTGAKVVWDLTGVEPGDYTITAGVDDGCGVCGQTKTEVVTVKECPDCLR